MSGTQKFRIAAIAFALGCLILAGLPALLAQGGEADASTSGVVLARVKYSGGGDWYNDQSSEVNLLKFIAENTTIKVNPAFEFVELTSDKLFTYPLIFMTGHGNVVFTDSEAKRLRSYLDNGGFLYIDDDYGMDTAIRREMKKVFPDQEMRELPFSHPLYHCFYEFSNGLPKIHEHAEHPPQGFGLFTRDNRLCVFYTFETNPSDGWADPEVHNDPPEKREAALKIGTNIVVYALTH